MNNIIFQTQLDDDLVISILRHLSRNLGNLTMLELSILLGSQYKENCNDWEKLLLHLMCICPKMDLLKLSIMEKPPMKKMASSNIQSKRGESIYSEQITHNNH